MVTDTERIDALEKKIKMLGAYLERECERQYNLHEKTILAVNSLVEKVAQHFEGHP